MAYRGSRQHNKLSVLPQQTRTVYKAVSAFPAAPSTSDPLDRTTVTSGFFPSKQFGSPSMPDWPSVPSSVPLGKSEPIAPSYDFQNSFLETSKLPTLSSPRFHNAFVSKLERSETLRSMVDVCKDLGIRDIAFDEEFGRANGTFFAEDHSAIDFHFSLHSAEYDGASRIFAQIISGAGCRIAFSRFKSEMIKILKKKDVVYHTEICEAVWDPRLCPSLPLMEEEREGDDLERLRERVRMCLLDCETGYARTIGEDAPQLARFSEDLKARTLMKEIPSVLERLIKLMEPSFESVLVRCVLVCLVNLCDGDENMVRECRDKYQMCELLKNLRERWSRTQYPFGQDFPHSVVDSSREIIYQANLAMSKMS